MSLFTAIIIPFILFFLSTEISFAQNKITDETALIVTVFDKGFFTEGPAYGPDGCIYFSDLTFTNESGMIAGIIWKHDTKSGTTSLYRSPSGMANGIEFDLKGNMIVCEGADFGGRKIVSTDNQSGVSKIIAPFYKNKPFNSPNDLVIDSRNRIYFTDPRYSGHEEMAQQCFGVYRIENSGEVKLLIDDIKMPNGIALSPDESRLYIGCNFEGDESRGLDAEMAVYIFDVDKEGNISNRKKFINYPEECGPDGLTVDKSGNLFIALRDEKNPGIHVYTPSGEFITNIPLPEVPSNLTFGRGKNRNILFITAGKSLYKIKTITEGNLPEYGN